ncbi:MAG TPA: phosphatase PAP2 family protein [Bacteroidia bacterium]|jgi:undecaprenyl-diphosphatase
MDIINTLKDLDTQLFLFLNSKHNSFFDPVMFWVSHKFFWIPLYLFFLFLAWKYYGKNVWLVAIAAGLAILLADQISVHAFKNIFLRYRPCHNCEIGSQVHLNGGRGGMYGFISSHASNTFALAMLLWLLFRNKMKYFGFFVFLWAAFVSYSRIYNGVHYPADIIAGAIVGMGIGVVVFKLFSFIENKISRNEKIH